MQLPISAFHRLLAPLWLTAILFCLRFRTKHLCGVGRVGHQRHARQGVAFFVAAGRGSPGGARLEPVAHPAHRCVVKNGFSFAATLTLALSIGVAVVVGAVGPTRAEETAFAERSPTFEKQTLTERFVAEGCALADFDRDGHVDLTAGNLIWYGPDFTRRDEFTPPANNPEGMTKTPYDPARGYSDYFLSFAHDFTGDSWPDILVYGPPGEAAQVFVNPQHQRTAWEKHSIFDTADGESPDLLDVTGDGRPELLVHARGQLGFAEIDWSRPLANARFHPITPKTPENDKKYFRYTHGSGAGDVNGDGRIDLVMKEGWFEHPAAEAASPLWRFHPGPFGPPGGRGGAQMYVYDVNGDGRNDVITSYDGHGYGLGWFEQRSDGGFSEHRIMGALPDEHPHGVAFSQLHSLRLVDIDGDGLLDILTGKRRWAHGISGDVEPNAPPVLYWFRLRRDGNGAASYEPRRIDDDSGVGTQVTAGDVTGDGKADVAVANKRGVFIFRQR
ncbi:MAG: FG-GAP repeat domain-containing protein [Planctomycetia bacterium]